MRRHARVYGQPSGTSSLSDYYDEVLDADGVNSGVDGGVNGGVNRSIVFQPSEVWLDALTAAPARSSKTPQQQQNDNCRVP